MCWTIAYTFTCAHKAGSNPPYICNEAIQGHFCIHCRIPQVISRDSGRTLNWNWRLQALIVAKSGKILVKIDVIRDIVGVGCVMTRQFNGIDNNSSLQRMCHKIQAHSSRWFWVASYRN